jgi:hypothetical protein
MPAIALLFTRPMNISKYEPAFGKVYWQYF